MWEHTVVISWWLTCFGKLRNTSVVYLASKRIRVHPIKMGMRSLPKSLVIPEVQIVIPYPQWEHEMKIHLINLWQFLLEIPEICQFFGYMIYLYPFKFNIDIQNGNICNQLPLSKPSFCSYQFNTLDFRGVYYFRNISQSMRWSLKSFPSKSVHSFTRIVENVMGT